MIANVRERLLRPERLSDILSVLIDREAMKDAAVAERRRALEDAISGTEEKLARLYRAIEHGIVELDAQLGERIAALKIERDLAKASLERIASQAAARNAVTPEKLEAFGRLMDEKIATGDVQARKAYLRTVIDRIEVDDHAVRIIGDKASLAAVIAGQGSAAKNVRGFVRKWRARNDSNVRPSDS